MSAYLVAADRIGRRVCETAFWHDGRCNWVGALPDEGPYGQTIINYAALGPDLYGGTSGVALFLAELHAATGDVDARRTALGALRHAHAHAGDPHQPAGPGLYAGRIGIALASVRIGLLLGEHEAVQQADALLAELRPDDEFDLMTGNAGTIVGLLALARPARAQGAGRPRARVRREAARRRAARRARPVLDVAHPAPQAQPDRPLARRRGGGGRAARAVARGRQAGLPRRRRGGVRLRARALRSRRRQLAGPAKPR